ncbi:hypothetical protein NE237_011229 [Protea cynaroides]|uniref:2Fe-2S ferredoxin-type domain-containing protein n=1 Tax=Protea cynaroides TaxID=273540 RepID=A0A9Q0GWN0_9MAGN|nr:hypothetical protein NE237_011229 [Protea cynaroides]
MFAYRLLLVGRMVKQLSRGQFTSVSRAEYLQRPHHCYLRPMIHRPFCTTAADNSCKEGTVQEEKISVTFVDKNGEEKNIKVPIGMSMLEAAHQNDIELEGACEGSLACSTCHVIVMDVDYYNKLEEPVDEENDMLDLAFGLTETSRLGCQVIAKPELDGIRLALPAATRNFAVDGLEEWNGERSCSFSTLTDVRELDGEASVLVGVLPSSCSDGILLVQQGHLGEDLVVLEDNGTIIEDEIDSACYMALSVEMAEVVGVEGIP